MRRFSLIPLALVALLGASTSGQQGQPLLEKIGPNAYDVVADWALPYPKAGFAFGSLPGVFVESPDRIFVAMRGEAAR